MTQRTSLRGALIQEKELMRGFPEAMSSSSLTRRISLGRDEVWLKPATITDDLAQQQNNRLARLRSNFQVNAVALLKAIREGADTQRIANCMRERIEHEVMLSWCSPNEPEMKMMKPTEREYMMVVFLFLSRCATKFFRTSWLEERKQIVMSELMQTNTSYFVPNSWLVPKEEE
jgi:hypothetical protein